MTTPSVHDGTRDAYKDGHADGFQACYEIMRRRCDWVYWTHTGVGCGHAAGVQDIPCAAHYTDCPLHKEKP